MLVELSQLLPKGYRVYVLFDSWYASAKLIKFCRRQRWHAICAVESNRWLNRKRMDHHNQLLRHKRYQRITLQALDPSRPAQTYCMRTVRGHLEEVADEVCGIISKRHVGLSPGQDCVVQPVARQPRRRWGTPPAFPFLGTISERSSCRLCVGFIRCNMLTLAKLQ
jgi:hypothetical protein